MQTEFFSYSLLQFLLLLYQNVTKLEPVLPKCFIKLWFVKQ